MKQHIDNNEKQKDTFNTPNGTIKKLDKFKGKKALIGDYSCSSYYNTKNVLLSLGFDIDINGSISEIQKAIRQGKKYDVIFSNNIYRSGTGEELLKNLKSIDGFTTPVILHSVTKDLEQHALKVGFNGFLPKPIVQKDTITLLNILLNMEQEGIT